MIKICKTNNNYPQDPLTEESTGIYMEFDNGNNISIRSYNSNRSKSNSSKRRLYTR